MKLSINDRGAVLVEFAVILPILVLLTLGMFEVGIALIGTMQLTFTTEAAARIEAANPGTGANWGKAQLRGATFTAGACDQGALITGYMDVPTWFFPIPTLSASACWPITKTGT